MNADRAAEGGVHCWWCGVEPYDVVQLMSFDGPVRLIPNWPPGDHEHEVAPPTPQQLVDRGYRALLRITEILSEGEA